MKLGLMRSHWFPLIIWMFPKIGVHPGRLTWNIQITHLERKMIFQTPKIMFHVNLPGCTPKWMVYNGTPLLKWMIWGENPPFKETPIYETLLILTWGFLWPGGFQGPSWPAAWGGDLRRPSKMGVTHSGNTPKTQGMEGPKIMGPWKRWLTY